MKRVLVSIGAVFVLTLVVSAQQPSSGAQGAAQPAGRGSGQAQAQDPRTAGGGSARPTPTTASTRRIRFTPPDTVWLEEMTWMDVRDAMKAGKTTIIISTGGIEPNGPWLALGKHNYVLRANCDAIARKLGNALCAPIVPFVPEGTHRAEERPHDDRRHDQHARGDVPGDAHRHRAQLQDARLPEHHPDRRQRREPRGHGRRRAEAQHRVEREPGRRPHPPSTTTTTRSASCWTSSASIKEGQRATASTTIRSSR